MEFNRTPQHRRVLLESLESRQLLATTVCSLGCPEAVPYYDSYSSSALVSGIEKAETLSESVNLREDSGVFSNENRLERLDAYYELESSETSNAVIVDEETDLDSTDDELLEEWDVVLDSILADENQDESGNASGGGGDETKPFVSGGFQNACLDYIFSADSRSPLVHTCSWIVNPLSDSPLSFSVQNSLNCVDVSITPNGAYTITPTGIVGSGVFNIVATNSAGSCYLPVYVYSGRVVGYPVEERVYGGEWTSVSDSGDDWKMLWGENEYRWKPIFENGVTPNAHKVQNVTLRDAAVGFYGPNPYSGFANANSAHTLCGSGGHDVEIDPAWPCAIGVPSNFGERRIDLSISISGGDVDHGISYCLDSNSISLSLNANWQYCPRIALNKVQSVAWTNVDDDNAIKLGLDPNDCSAMRCFPERASDAPDASGNLPNVNDRVNVTVTLNAAIPDGMSASVYLNYFDPRNPIGTGTIVGDGLVVGQRDNRGSAALSQNTLTWDSHSGRSSVATLTIAEAYAGDNYVVAAHPSPIVESRYHIVDSCNNSENDPVYSSELKRPGNSNAENELVALDNSLKTPVLSIWRTLWVERDQLKYSDLNSGVVISDAPTLNGLVSSQIARACIVVREYTRNINSILLNNDYWINFTPSSNNYIGNYCSLGANIPTSCPEFWTVRMVGGFAIDSGVSIENRGILGYCHNKTFFIANKTIESYVNARNERINTNLSLEQSLDVNDVKQVVALHELGHAMGLVHQESGVMKSPLDLENIDASFTIENLWAIQSQKTLACSMPQTDN